MGYTVLKNYEQVSCYVSQISEIADKNREAFGFLSSTAYEQMASKGQLWVAVNDSKEIKGYLMFGGTMPTLKVFQLFSCPSVKGHGLGSLLIGALKEFARDNHFHSISARVASDLPANMFWEKVGFPIYQQVKGGESTKRTINIRGHSLSENDLLSSLPKAPIGVEPNRPLLDRPVYAIDINLLLDVYRARRGYKKVIKIMQTGLQGGYSICITPEFKKELERQSANYLDDPVLRLASVFPEVSTKNDVKGIAESIRKIVFPNRKSNSKSAQNDSSDLLHLAYCISARISGFITREKALLRACNKIRDEHNIVILSPDELVFDDGDAINVDAPLSTDFMFSTSIVSNEIKNFLNSYSAPSTITDILNSESPIKGETLVYEARFDAKLFGVYFLQKPIKGTNSALAGLYIDESCPQSVAAIDHFLESAIRYRCGFTYRLDLYIGKGQNLTEETLRKKGFLPASDHFVKIVINQFLNSKNWGRFANDLERLCGFSIPKKLPTKKELVNTGICIVDEQKQVETFSWFDFESVIGPRFILSHARDCILVPIRENYAMGLIGDVTNQLSLLSSHAQTLLLEKAYFRYPGKASLFRRGGIVAFYVSGSNSIQEIIGFARVTYSAVVSIHEAFFQVERQGVLSQEELKIIADKNDNLHVFTFDNFLEFDQRMPFARAKQLGLISDANLVSPERICLEQLEVLIRETFYE